MRTEILAFLAVSSFLAAVGSGCGMVAPIDGLDGGDLPDVGSPVDASLPDAVTSVPDATAKRDSSVAPVDAGPIGDVCTPPPVVTYTKAWIAPHPHQAACAQSDIDIYLKYCLGQQSDGGAACKSFLATANGKVCSACLLPTSGGLGPLIATGTYVAVNVAGCIAIAQNTVVDGAGCASAQQYLDECEQAACSACARDPNSTPDMLNACDLAATNGACSAESAAAKCEDQLIDAGGPGASCLAGTDFGSTFEQIAPIFCLK